MGLPAAEQTMLDCLGQLRRYYRGLQKRVELADQRPKPDPLHRHPRLGNTGQCLGRLVLDGKPWAPLVFSPAKYPYTAGVWRGPLIVVVDSLTYSAAEEFASVLQDNHAALIMGAPTGGAGSGHTDGGTPTTLPNSHGIFELPDCARFRANGDNEVAGVQPTVLAGLRRFDGVDRQAHFLNLALPEAERLAQEVAR